MIVQESCHETLEGSTSEGSAFDRARWFGMPVAAVLLTACVTINVYFPAAEAKEAAKEFVEKVIGDEAQQRRRRRRQWRRHGKPAAAASIR